MISNQQDEARLNEFSSLVDADLGQGEISAREAAWLNDIVAQADDGDWGEANAAARQMMEDQVQGNGSLEQ